MENIEKGEAEEVKKIPENPENNETDDKEEEKKSALHNSIKDYGTNSYYYAHAPKEFDIGAGKRWEGSGLIHGGEPIKVDPLHPPKADDTKKAIPKKVTKYYWDDQKKKVKLYIDLTQEIFGGRTITESMIDMDIDETSLKISIADEESNTYEFVIKKLYDKVEPEKCKMQVTKDKIKVYLQKWIETKWKELAAKK